MLKVSRRGGFSDRNGIKPENAEIQLLEFDNRTRNEIATMISKIYNKGISNVSSPKDERQKFVKYILSNIYGQFVDDTKYYDVDKVLEIVFETLQKDDYDSVLTLVEGIIEYIDRYLPIYKYTATHTKVNLYKMFNELFQKEYVGYRFIDKIISPISDCEEIDSINAALSSKYSVVREHISKAHSLLANRDNPDYENSIKESISAVEATCKIITGVSGGEATLGKMLKKLEDKGVVIHSALKSAFNILYGYTSDANGIRHAGDIGGPYSTFEEAKFMLVSCSAFINYLKGVSAD